MTAFTVTLRLQGQETGLSDIFPDSDLRIHVAISRISVYCLKASSRPLVFGLSTELICLNDGCHQDPDGIVKGKWNTWRHIS